ncbi:hypothetical protein D3C80_1839980 [compost metagenome]
MNVNHTSVYRYSFAAAQRFCLLTGTFLVRKHFTGYTSPIEAETVYCRHVEGSEELAGAKWKPLSAAAAGGRVQSAFFCLLL